MVQQLFILNLEPDLDPKPEKLCEHGASREDRLCYVCLQHRSIICIEYEFHAFFNV